MPAFSAEEAQFRRDWMEGRDSAQPALMEEISPDVRRARGSSGLSLFQADIWRHSS